jgi:hypothetical protein
MQLVRIGYTTVTTYGTSLCIFRAFTFDDYLLAIEKPSVYNYSFRV